jgi:hypothetical protein
MAAAINVFIAVFILVSGLSIPKFVKCCAKIAFSFEITKKNATFATKTGKA